MRISDWSSDVCSSDLATRVNLEIARRAVRCVLYILSFPNQNGVSGMNRRVTVLLAALALPMVMASGAQAQESDNCNPVVDGTGDPVHSSSDFVVSNSFPVPCPTAETPAAAPAAPAPEMRTEYLVFFDWDQSDITPTGDAIIQDAATAISGGQATRVTVNGYADTSGPTDYNAGLSDLREEEIGRAPGRERVGPYE